MNHLRDVTFKKVIFATCILGSVFCFSQQGKKMDSTLTLIQDHTKRDSIRVKLLIREVNNIIDKNALKAHDFAQESLEISKEIKWIKGIALSLRVRGLIYYREGNTLKALELWYDALDKSKGMQDNNRFALSVYNNLGNIYADSNEFDKALSYYTKFLNKANELKDKKYQIQALANIGLLLTENEETIEEGLKKLYHALDLAKEENNQRLVASILLNLGLSYRRNNGNEKALQFYKEAYELAQKNDNKYIQLLVLNNISTIYIAKKNYKKAEKNGKEVVRLSKEIGVLEWEVNGWSILNNVYEGLNEHKKNVNSLTNYLKLEDSLRRLQNKEEVFRLQTKYEYNQKKILLEAKHNDEQRLINQKLNQQKFLKRTTFIVLIIVVSGLIIGFVLYRRKQDAVAKAKEAEFKTKVADTELKVLRTQMNPHFIFNSLNSIGNYILNNNTDAANNYLTKFSKLMRQTLESSEKEEILLQKDIELLKTYLDIEKKRFAQGFNYDIKIDNDIDIENTLIPPMMLQPFVENSIWHGISKMAGNGTILIEIKKHKNMIIYAVDDNGVGRQQTNKLNHSKKDSLGIKITKNRIDIINKRKHTNANLKIIDKEKGTRVEVTLPLQLAFL